MPIRHHLSLFFQSRRGLWLLTIVVALLPLLISILLITAQERKLSDFIPYWNDEVSNWHQILTFKEVGFQGGYYTYNEFSPAAGFTHFYTYGPWYSMVYGSIARVIGWELPTVLLVNAAFVVLAVIIFCRTTQLDALQTLLMGLVLATFWAFLLYLFTAFQEAFQQSLAIVLAAVFYHAFRKKDTAEGWFRVLGFLVILTAGIMRMSWAILFLPYFLLIAQPSLKYRLLALGMSIGALVLVVAVTEYTGAPGNNTVFTMLSNFSVSVGYGVSQLWDYFRANGERYLNFGKDPLDMAQTLDVLGIILVGCVAAFVLYRRRKSSWLEALFYSYNLGAILLASCLLYLVGSDFGDFRVISTHLMIVLLLLVAFNHKRIVLLLIAIHILFIPAFLNSYQTMTAQRFRPNHTRYEDFKAVTQEYMPYDPEAVNAWCNAILFSYRDYKPNLLGVPAGIGYSFYKNVLDRKLTFKSQYLMLSDADYKRLNTRSDAPQLELLTATPLHNLYRNLSAGCD